MPFTRRDLVSIALILLLAAAWKGMFLLLDVIPFNADEAVVALMARHILMGERPVFFYGQAYMGSLDAFLAAGGFLIFGQQVWVLRLVQSILYLGTVLTTIFIGREGLGSLKLGLLAGLFLAVPTVNVALYTTATLGGYGEALLIGNLLLLIALRVNHRSTEAGTPSPSWGWYLAWGILAGLGLWANGLSLVYSLPSGIFLLWTVGKNRPAVLSRSLVLAGVGFLLGSLPWWWYAAANGISALIAELLGTAVAVEKSSWLVRTGMHLVSFLLLGLSVTFGFRPPWNVNWLALPLAPLVGAYWVGALVFFWRMLRRGSPARPAWVLLAGVVGTLLAGFLFTPFGADPSGRYFVPLAVPLALAAAAMILHISRRAWHTAALVALVLAFQAWGTLQAARAYPPGLTTQFYEPTVIDHRADADLIAFLKARGETRGYTNYWTAYPLAFLSAEELIFIPRLPYHLDLRYTPRDDRYAPYTELVKGSPRAAYITTRNPALDTYLREAFSERALTWEEKRIGDYLVYYNISDLVRPSDIGLGELRE